MLNRSCFLLLAAAQIVCFSVRAQTNLFDAIRSGSTDELENALAHGSDANDSMLGVFSADEGGSLRHNGSDEDSDRSWCPRE